MNQNKFVFGTMKLAGEFNGMYTVKNDENKALELLDMVNNSGIDYFDTAPIYAKGHAEILLSKFLKQYPNKDIKISTKVGVDISGLLPKLDYTFEGLKQSMLGSLSRLDILSVESVLIHNPGTEVLKKDDIYKFSDWVLGNKYASSTGLSLLHTENFFQLRPTNSFTKLMLEFDDYEQNSGKIFDIKYDIYIRSILQNFDIKSDNIRGFIENKLEFLKADKKVKKVLIAPRNSSQLKAYF